MRSPNKYVVFIFAIGAENCEASGTIIAQSMEEAAVYLKGKLPINIIGGFNVRPWTTCSVEDQALAEARGAWNATLKPPYPQEAPKGLYADVKFPEGTHWEVLVNSGKGWGGVYRAWYLIGKNYGVHFWFVPGRKIGDTWCDVIAGIECHTFCQEDDKALRCQHSPTGFCHPDGTSMGGHDLYETAKVYGKPDEVDESWVWSRLISWYNDRVNVRED